MKSKSIIGYSVRSFTVGLMALILVLVLASVFWPLPRPYYYAVIGGVALTSYRIQRRGFPPLTSRQKTIVSAFGAAICVSLDMLASTIINMGSFEFPILPHDATLGAALMILSVYTSAIFALTRFLLSSVA